MSIIHNVHDKFFKTSMSNVKVAQDFFKYYLPENIQAQLDFNTLELQPGSYIDKAFQATASDILYKIKFLIESRNAYLYILAEHQSSVDYLMPFRLWQYTVGIWNEHLKKNNGKDNNEKKKNKEHQLPLVIPIVFYNGEKRYNGPRGIQELIDAPQAITEQFLWKPFHLVDTHDIEDENLRKQHLSGLMTFVMKHAYEKESLNFIQSFLELLNCVCEEGEEGLDFPASVLTYFINQLKTSDPVGVAKTLEAGILSSKKGETMKVIDYWIQKGETIGLQKGESIGLQKGESTILLRQLELKFGAIPPKYLQLVQTADSETLLQWAEKVLEANSLKVIFDE